MGTRVASSLQACLDCDDLLSGASRRLVPHQYLVLSRRMAGSGRMEYQCLVCRTSLVYEAGADPTWTTRNFLPANDAAAHQASDFVDVIAQKH